MSDTQDPAFIEGQTSTEAAPDTGTTAGEETTVETPQEPERRYLDLDDDTANRYVRVKVDGEELEVPLSEALSGYSRTADYTRKTQELAQQRQQAEYALTLQRALQASPEQTIQLLAQQHGLTLAQENALRRDAGMAERQPSMYEDDTNDYSDPLERKLTTMERKLQEWEHQQQLRAAHEELQQTIGSLQAKYQFDQATAREIVATALEQNRGPRDFETIYKAIAYDRQIAAQQQYQQGRAQEDQRRTQAKAEASQVIGTGGSAASAGAPPPQPTKFNSYSEAIAASYDQVASRSGGV